MLSSPELQALEAHGVPIALRLRTGVLLLIGEQPLLHTLLAGGFAGAVSRTCTAPLDQLKMLAQEGRIAPPGPRAWHHPTVTVAAARPHNAGGDLARVAYIARHVLAHEGGLRAFWRGNGTNVLKAGPEHATAFATRQALLQRVCANPAVPTFAENVAVGALAGMVAQTLLYPMEVVKTRMAVAKRGEYAGIADCVRQSLRRGGARDLYRGLLASTAGIAPHRGLEMGTWFTLSRVANDVFGAPPPIIVSLSIGLFASVMAQVLTYPLNLARTRLQMQGVNGRPLRYRGLGDCLRQTVADGGPRGLFVGLLPNLLKAAPASMLMYASFSRAQHYLDAATHEARLARRVA